MHLHSLELFGFKSFADKTTFNFHQGITAIVGPNGCGKSNVLDAVRWVLGEQSAKSLRGDEMADVIFNGTDTRKPVGFAEVSLTLSDCAKDLAVDWHDVRVTRRVYRDGNSEYLLNKTPCRLRDIQNLFADTGVARAAYSMMEQGKIDMILSSRPEDRRAVFEEAAGITKYKTQKREALRKLEATDANLLRIGDVIKEVKRQIGSLQRQAGKARRYQTLHADLRILDTHYSRKQLDSLETELARCHAEIARLGESEEANRARIDNSESQLAEQRRALEEVDEQIADGRSELQRLQSQIGGHQNRIQFNRQRAEELTELIERSRKDIAAAQAKRAQQSKELEEANALVEKTGQLLQAKEAELAKLTRLISKSRAERSAHDSKLEALRSSQSKNEKRIAELEDEISGLAIRRDATEETRRDLDAAISEARATRDKVRKELATARAAAETGQKHLDLLKAKLQASEKTLHEQQERLASTEKSLIEIERALAEKESRLEILHQLDEEGEGLAQGSQALLKGLDNPSRIQPAVAGALVSNLDVDPEFIAAIEAVLGRNLQAIVLKDAQLAPEIIATLKEKKIGQAALVLPGLSNSSAKTQTALPQEALAWAREKVKAPDSLAPLVARLLHNVAIFRDLEAALSFKKHGSDCAAATLAGEFISAEGIVFGGSRDASADSLLERKARISVLTAEYGEVRGQRDALLQERDAANAIFEKAGSEFKETRRQYESADRAQSTSDNRILFLERESQESEQKIDQLRSEQTVLAQQIQTADERIAKLEEELASERTAWEIQQNQQLEIQGAHENAAKREDEASEQLNELRLTLATERQRYENLIAQRQPMTAREAELAEAITDRQAEIANFEKRLAAQSQESKSAEAAIEKQNAECAELKATIAALTDQRAEHSRAMNEMESNLRAIRNSLNELHDLRSKQQVRETQLQMQADNLAEHISHRYQVNLREIVSDQMAFEKTLRAQLKRRQGGSSVASADANNNGGEAASKSEAIDVDLEQIDVQKLIRDLTTQLDNMGPVNLDAVHEYDELEERYKFLEGQNNDLTNSRRELLDVIAQINSTTRKLFAETFSQVRINFCEMFAELFRGGRADLSLLDENDPLNCGIEISAKPPGKQLQSVSLLSGGERAMTAVALLFAIYMVRPSPFCILDEVDAPLDEGNINCFIRVLDRFVKQSQFIIMTHNKRTIAKADVLYGVTMEERGVSKLVGMKLTAPRQVTTEQTPSNGYGETATQRQFPLESAQTKHSFAAR
ncbi:MAG: chromosome segregation protein SMC [Verrucomicrobia bacterium]|nr:MAG: chromosome segregation protein SMC [Verrucomicrobiota bacterium]